MHFAHVTENRKVRACVVFSPLTIVGMLIATLSVLKQDSIWTNFTASWIRWS